MLYTHTQLTYETFCCDIAACFTSSLLKYTSVVQNERTVWFSYKLLKQIFMKKNIIIMLDNNQAKEAQNGVV